jgi:hypothetical protein
MKTIYHTDSPSDEKPIEVSFADRLRHTIAIMRVETQQGVEDWTPTIVRLQEVLSKEDKGESQ